MPKIGNLKFRLEEIDLRPSYRLFDDFEMLRYYDSEHHALVHFLDRARERLVFTQDCNPPSEKTYQLAGGNQFVLGASVTFFVSKIDDRQHRFDSAASGRLRTRTPRVAGLSAQDWETAIAQAYGTYSSTAPIDAYKAHFGPDKGFNLYVEPKFAYFRIISNRFGRREWAILKLPIGAKFSARLFKDCSKEKLTEDDWADVPEPVEFENLGGNAETLKLMIRVAKGRITLAKQQLQDLWKSLENSKKRLEELEDGEDHSVFGREYDRRLKESEKLGQAHLDKLKQRLKDLRAKLGDLVEDDP